MAGLRTGIAFEHRIAKSDRSPTRSSHSDTLTRMTDCISAGAGVVDSFLALSGKGLSRPLIEMRTGMWGVECIELWSPGNARAGVA